MRVSVSVRRPCYLFSEQLSTFYHDKCLCGLFLSKTLYNTVNVYCFCNVCLKGLYPPVQFILTVTFLQFLTSLFLPARFHLFSTSLNFFEDPGPQGTCPGYPPLSVGLTVGLSVYCSDSVYLWF